MRVKLHEKFDWMIPGKRAMISYDPGEHTMKREAGEEAVRLGKGKEIHPPKKDD